ncbi:hypothetical protein QBC33DRAFT_551772 [Phialemonium atrogriseum]|uniref:Uncharacterized protein n=1 Tax=Phialemonium atrogriseum TaxID=1093897 RepID=A0AAJ0FGN6_9PEZI|nr:uncharacterized protein QBC33DRAFT_551772 [Phialemonium atrogriseum]KAK1762538.1 hypothetical protein QBC33DRAFT_551772 [Phialemonium atrogriseum]
MGACHLHRVLVPDPGSIPGGRATFLLLIYLFCTVLADGSYLYHCHCYLSPSLLVSLSPSIAGSFGTTWQRISQPVASGAHRFQARDT